MQIPEHLKKAVDNYLKGTATALEEQQVNEWFYSFNDEEVIVAAPANNMREWLEQHMGENILKNIHARQETAAVRRMPAVRRWSWAAASIILVLGVGAYLWTSRQQPPTPDKITSTGDIPPGSNGAMLTLADGSQVRLDSIQNGVVALQGGVTAKIVDNALLYEGAGSEPVYNTMTTPKGRQFHLTLPDGTEVWLNAGSAIRYPTAFKGKERRVDMTGEAYFEVAKNEKIPFKVTINNRAEVDVLGTHFNVNAYNNEATVNTTLLEGSIKTNGITVKPGQQAVTNTNSTYVQSANIDNVMAWKNGLFDFNGLSFEEVMRQLERWYDINVMYENNKAPNKRLAGEMTRAVSLNTLLEYLESIGVHYRLNGRTLIILS